MDARPFLRATSSLHARTTRVRFESRKTLSRLSPHRRFSTRPDLDAKTFPRKAKKKPRAQFSDSASLTLNVLKYVVAFFGPFWRNPRVNIFLVPCLRPLLRARWLPMMRRRLLFDVWKERGRRKEEEAQVFSFFFKDEVVCCRSVLCVCVFGLKNKKKDDTKNKIIHSSSLVGVRPKKEKKN